MFDRLKHINSTIRDNPTLRFLEAVNVFPAFFYRNLQHSSVPVHLRSASIKGFMLSAALTIYSTAGLPEFIGGKYAASPSQVSLYAISKDPEFANIYAASLAFPVVRTGLDLYLSTTVDDEGMKCIQQYNALHPNTTLVKYCSPKTS